MNIAVTYLIYLVLSISITIGVARTLHKNGRVFLVEAFHGNDQLADSVNHLLVVGFYLINIGYVTLRLKYGVKPSDLAESIEFLSTKVGLVLLVLGIMHFFNLYIFSTMRRRARHEPERSRQIDPEPGAAGDPGDPPLPTASEFLSQLR